jgi:hypothetical protein
MAEIGGKAQARDWNRELQHPTKKKDGSRVCLVRIENG